MHGVPAKATGHIPSPARRSSKSGKRGKGGQAIDAKNGQQHLAAPPALSPTIDRVFLLYEQRRDLLSTASGMTNRLKALTNPDGARTAINAPAKAAELLVKLPVTRGAV